MPDNIINRERAEALIREQVVPQIFQDVPKQSIFMQLARKLPNMTSKTTRMRVLDMLPMAYWVNGDTGFKKTSKQAWDNVYINAGELAVIVPIPEAVVDDADFDIVGEVLPRVNEAIAQKVDSATFFGNDVPPEWGTGSDIITRARQAGNNVAPGNKDWYDIIMAEGGVIDRVESAGYEINGGVGVPGIKAKLRGLRTTDGFPLYTSQMQGATRYGLDGNPLHILNNGAFDKAAAQLIVGDFAQAVYAIRQDVTIKILTEGVISDESTGEIIYNLPQQDMIALRVKFRMGWALPNPATRLDEDRLACPFAYVEPATPITTQTVTITVKDGAGNDAEAVSGAIVEIANGARLKTNASGQVVFNLRSGSYDYVVKASGFKKYSGSVTVASAAVTEAVALTATT